MADPTPSKINKKISESRADADLSEKMVHMGINEEANVPFPSTTFEPFDIPQEFIKKLYEEGCKEPTPIQAKSWPIVMQGRDIVAVAKTGSGKKLGFLIPSFMHIKRLQNDPKNGPTVLVLCATDRIVTQVQSEAVKFGAPAGIQTICLHGDTMKVPQPELEGVADVVVVTPELLIKNLENEKLSLKQVSYLVLYDSDVLLMASVELMIHKIILQLPSKDLQTLVFTTTWPKEVLNITTVLYHDPVMVSVHDTSSGAVTGSSTDLEGLSDTSNALVPKELGSLPKKKLLVLDINGILADIVMLFSKDSEQAHFMIKGKSVFKRPFCDDFLKFCFANFEVGIWSSRNRNNLLEAVNCIIGDLKTKLLFFWDQSKCTTTNLRAKDNKEKPVFLKELKKLWENEDSDLPWQKGEFTKTNTLLVDDSPYKALCNPLYTAISPDPYTFKNKDDKSLGVEGDLRLYLEKLAKADDVQCYVKNNPFGQPPMTESHPDWNYYLPAIRYNENFEISP